MISFLQFLVETFKNDDVYRFGKVALLNRETGRLIRGKNRLDMHGHLYDRMHKRKDGDNYEPGYWDKKNKKFVDADRDSMAMRTNKENAKVARITGRQYYRKRGAERRQKIAELTAKIKKLNESREPHEKASYLGSHDAFDFRNRNHPEHKIWKHGKPAVKHIKSGAVYAGKRGQGYDDIRSAHLADEFHHGMHHEGKFYQWYKDHHIHPVDKVKMSQSKHADRYQDVNLSAHTAWIQPSELITHVHPNDIRKTRRSI